MNKSTNSTKISTNCVRTFLLPVQFNDLVNETPLNSIGGSKPFQKHQFSQIN